MVFIIKVKFKCELLKEIFVGSSIVDEYYFDVL